MKYRDRQGHTYKVTTKQDRLLNDAYDSYIGRSLLEIASLPALSKLSRKVLSSRMSSGFIEQFAENNKIDMFDYEDKQYTSFNDFFTRKIKEGRRYFEPDEKKLVSPSDGKVSAYAITNANSFVIKNSVYNVESLLRDKKLAAKYAGGYALVIRLSVDDYHRYIYPLSGIKSHDRVIEGFLNTVNPVANRHVEVYKENTRHYCMIRTEHFGDVIQMEVGALLVGRISNHHPWGNHRVRQGEEKGYFEFGGSTIVLLLEKGKAIVDEDLLKNTEDGCETKVLQGEQLAVCNS
ncbi:phosphatidylserine decarboxylase [Ruminococcus sp.]|uniref:phosphatidylserine decarboxylase n=1 Tax=Ruminococcus sp. TaxID=41978 RepID=UPI0025FB3FFD|nr:phosphatidylserine decarboxylase [Ruminococcus sp.]MBQ8966353.1 phosphatidylserine decarboxylase [Ruminococcus sp.]